MHDPSEWNVSQKEALFTECEMEMVAKVKEESEREYEKRWVSKHTYESG